MRTDRTKHSGSWPNQTMKLTTTAPMSSGVRRGQTLRSSTPTTTPRADTVIKRGQILILTYPIVRL